MCCQVEVFNLLFIKEHEKRHVVHCVDCARRHAPRLAGFICLEEYKLQELQDVFDNFQLHVVSAGTTRDGTGRDGTVPARDSARDGAGLDNILMWTKRIRYLSV